MQASSQNFRYSLQYIERYAWLVASGLVIIFIWISFLDLDLYPKIHFDEISIVSPGYKLFTKGIFGSDLYKGFFNQDNIYLEVMPLMSLMTGLATKLLGVGVQQMRVVPVMAGAMTLALTYLTACVWAQQLKNEGHANVRPNLIALLSMCLLLFWQWALAGASDFIGSGIPLVDVSRIARYDILVPVFGMGAFLSWMYARRTENLLFDVIGGILVGLATLSNVYGIFWGCALFVLFWLDSWLFTKRPIARNVISFAAAMIVIVSLWGIIILLNWQDFLGQSVKHQGRLDLLNPHFYLDSIFQEIHRYNLGARQAVTYARVGFWLLVIGIPASFLLLTKQVTRERTRAGLWLSVPCFIFPLLFAVLVNEKRFYYLVTIAPLFAILLAWGTAHFLQSKTRYWQFGATVVMTLAFIQGTMGIIHLHTSASNKDSPTVFFTQLRELVPHERRVLGPQQYWPALYQEEYQATTLLFIISNPKAADLLTFDEAFLMISPEIVVVDSDLISWLKTSPVHAPAIEEAFWSYMEQQDAKLIGELSDNEGRPVQIYQLRQEGK